MIEMNKICSPRNAQKNPHGVSVRRGSLWLAVFFISVQPFADKICATMEFFDGLSFIKHTRDLIGRFAKSNV